MLTNVLDSYHLDGVGKLAARTVTCWKPHKVFAYGVEKKEKLGDGWGICDVSWELKARRGSRILCRDGRCA